MPAPKNSLVAFLFLWLLSTLASDAGAKSFMSEGIRLQFVDSASKLPIYGVNVQLRDTADKIIRQGITDEGGFIFFYNLPANEIFFLEFSAIGYHGIKNFKIQEGEKLKKIVLSASSYVLSTVEITGEQDSILIKGDTTSYNADLYRSESDENARDILLKLPGAELQNGKLTIEGEKILSVQLDGEEYFKQNSAAASDQIPSDIISRIEIIDVVSPEDPTLKVKAVNIVSKKNTFLVFGKLTAAYGTEERYRVAGNCYQKSERHRLTIMSDLNNINKEDLLDSSLPPLFEGDNKLFAGGLNYLYRSQKEMKLDANMNFNSIQRKQYQLFDQRLLSDPEAFSLLHSTNNRSVKERIQSYSLKINTPTGARSSLSAESEGNLSSSLMLNQFTDKRYSGPVNIYYLNAFTSSEGNGSIFKNNIQFLYHFKERDGKLIRKRKLMLYASYFEKAETTTDTMSYAFMEAFSPDAWQIHSSSIPVSTKKGVIQFTENWGENYTVKYDFSEELSSTKNNITTLLFNTGEFTNGSLDSNLTAINEMNRQKHRASIHITRKSDKTQTMAGLSFERLDLKGTLLFPAAERFSPVFFQPLPTLSFTYKKNPASQFKVAYVSKQNAPLFNQLNPVLDNAAPSRPYLGQTGLRAENTHVLDISYRGNGRKKIFHQLKLRFTYTKNYIGERVFIPAADSLIYGITVPGGTQLISPMNFNNRWTTDFSANHERNIAKYKYGIQYGYTLDILPSRVNDATLYTTVNRYNTGVTGNFYPNKFLSFSCRSFGSYATIASSSDSNKKRSVFNWNAGLNIRYLVWHSLLLNLESNSFQALAFDVESNQKITSIVSFSAKHGLFKNQKASLQLQVHDLFNQNKDITQNPSALYITQEQKMMLGRYFLFGFGIKF